MWVFFSLVLFLSFCFFSFCFLLFVLLLFFLYKHIEEWERKENGNEQGKNKVLFKKESIIPVCTNNNNSYFNYWFWIYGHKQMYPGSYWNGWSFQISIVPSACSMVRRWAGTFTSSTTWNQTKVLFIIRRLSQESFIWSLFPKCD